MPYIAIKHLHLSLAGLALLLYVLRGVWLIIDSPRLNARWVRIAPHIVYTGLLLAGGTLATLSGQWMAGWIWTKLALLLVFVGLGVVAFRGTSRFPRSRRISIWGMGLLVYIMIFAVAAHHHALSQAAAPVAGVDMTPAAPNANGF